MKTIFRYTNLAIVMAGLLSVGAVASLAQDPTPDPCADSTATGDKFRAQFADKSIAGRKAAIETGKLFLEKYASCAGAEELANYLKTQVPKMEAGLKKAEEDKVKADLIARFDGAMKAKNWDEAYASGKEILARYSDEFRPVEIVLGSIGGEEALKNNFKYSDDTLKFAKQSIADLEAGKAFTVGKDTKYGLFNFEYPNKENALGWLNWYIGYITNAGKKDKVGSLPFLYKASQSASEVKDKPAPYALIGYYYVAEGDKLADEIVAMGKAQDPKDTEEVAKQKVDAIKAKEALSHGVNERAIDAFSRALARVPASDAAYKAEIKKALDFSYNRRFGKMDGLDAWVAKVQKQPFVNPTTPVTPITEPEPTTAPAASTTTAPTTAPAAPAKPGTPAAKPATTTTKPAASPAATTAKPQAKAKKAVAKKKTT